MKKFALLVIPLLMFACGGDDGTASSNNKMDAGESVTSIIVNPFVAGKGIDVEALKNNVDLTMDISKLSLSDIRILRNSFAARQGYCFMNADLRGIYSTTTWYDEIMEKRFWDEDSSGIETPIKYSKVEQEFIDKLLARENELKAGNFYQQGDKKLVNLNNIVNLFQFEELKPELMDVLGRNGFAIVPNDNIQMFHVYENNDYQQFPNFVTTDMYMQLFHMYFGYVLKQIEQEQFIPILTKVCNSMITDMNNIARTSSDESIKDLAMYNSTYYAIAFTALTGKKITVAPKYIANYNEELAHIEAAKNVKSDYLDYKDVVFPYSLFKPRGHYTRTPELKRYFKSMMWLQTAPFCLDNEVHLKRAALNASVLSNNKETLSEYKQLMEPISFIIGQPDNVSFLNLADIIRKGNYKLGDLLTNASSLNSFRKEVKKIAEKQNVIKPKQALSCVDKINFIPQRYLCDNEILQELVDVKNIETKRGYPKGLDVMAAFGSSSAEHILMSELKEGENWVEYPVKLSALKDKMKGVDWNATLYNKWIESLLNLQKPNTSYPYFMQSPQWNKKDLNASLASWAELKHDAILYAEQPMGAECGGAGPPDPYTVGYVEPNTAYWKTVIELIDLTKVVLKKNELLTTDISRITEELRENAEFLLSASNKELAGIKLVEKEYKQIELIGSTFEWLTLDLVKQKDEYIDGWENVIGPDKSVAVVADIYTANSENNPDKGILHVATGNVNDIYVVVEIEGYLYITKGAVFGYHEFHVPPGNRLTDEEWQKMLDKKQAPAIPEWMKEIIVPIKAPKTNEKIFYSSGC